MSTDLDGELPVRTRRRVTRRLIPFLMFIYLLAYLDRANLGVAKLQMQADMGFNDAVIGFGAGIFFLGYLLLDIPGSLIVERWSARKWIARIMVSWGVVAALDGVSRRSSVRLLPPDHAVLRFASACSASRKLAFSPALSSTSRIGIDLKIAPEPRATS